MLLASWYKGKYRDIVLSVVVFLLLDCTVLLVNLHLTASLQKDAQAVNLAGRQRMLTQRLSNYVYQLQQFAFNSHDTFSIREQIQNTSQLFTSTLNALQQGGETLDANGLLVKLSAVNHLPAQRIILDANTQWAFIQDKVNDWLQFSSSGHLRAMRFVIDENSTELLGLMNDLTVLVETQAYHRAQTLQLVQSFSFALAFFNFFIVIFYVIKQLKLSDYERQQAINDTHSILNVVNQGVILIDEHLMIRGPYSKEILNIFNCQQLKNQMIANVLSPFLSGQKLISFNNYLGMLFDVTIEDNQIVELNPIKNMDITIPDRHKILCNNPKKLMINFKRVYRDGLVSHVLITMSDISETVLLKKNIRKEKEKSKQQIKILSSIIYSNTELISEFISATFKSINDINFFLKDPNIDFPQMQGNLLHILSKLEHIKAEAQSIRLLQLADQVNFFIEDILIALENPILEARDLVCLALHLDELIAYIQQVDQCLPEVRSVIKQEGMYYFQSNLANKLHNYCSKMAKELDKKVLFVCSGLHEHNLSKNQLMMLSSITFQLLKNALVHGVETSEQRLQSQKKAVARIECHLSAINARDCELSFFDDGYGLDYEKLKRQALKMRLVDPLTLERYSSTHIKALVFESGLSTFDTVSDYAGRGMGLSSIKKQVLSHLGKIQVHSQVNRGTQIVITLPLLSVNQQTA